MQGLWSKVGAVSAVAAVAACAPASVNGTIDGAAMSVTEARAQLVENESGSSLSVTLAEFAFDEEPEEVRPADYEGKASLSLSIGPAGSGEFEVVQLEALLAEGQPPPERIALAFFLRSKNMRCEDGQLTGEPVIIFGSAGTVTLENAPKVGEEVRGSFEITLGEDEVTGSFTLPVEKGEVAEEPPAGEEDGGPACVE